MRLLPEENIQFSDINFFEFDTENNISGLPLLRRKGINYKAPGSSHTSGSTKDNE
jgi:hypothetical protein